MKRVSYRKRFQEQNTCRLGKEVARRPNYGWQIPEGVLFYKQQVEICSKYAIRTKPKGITWNWRKGSSDMVSEMAFHSEDHYYTEQVTYQGLFSPHEFYSGIDTYLISATSGLSSWKAGDGWSRPISVFCQTPLEHRHDSGLRSPVVPPSGRGTARDPHPLSLPPPPPHLIPGTEKDGKTTSFVSFPGRSPNLTRKDPAERQNRKQRHLTRRLSYAWDSNLQHQRPGWLILVPPLRRL